MNGGLNRTCPSPGQEPLSLATAALGLIRCQRTMVLATALSGQCWTAPVYYVYTPPGFYFFSSPRARHIEQGLNGDSAAASIFLDSDHWDQIQGIQMNGAIEQVRKKRTLIKVSAKFILKFPFAEPFLKPGHDNDGNEATPQLGDRVNLYAFIPKSIYYVNNQMGFGKRSPVYLKS